MAFDTRPRAAPTGRAVRRDAMGCIASTPAGEANNKPVPSSVGGTHYPNWTLPPRFTIEPPPTVGELERNREAFWDTQPSYGGSAEIWDVLKAAVASASSGDIETARLFVESAGCIVATPHLTVVFDERGAKYDIPRWVLATPANVAPDVSNAGDVA